MVTTKTTLVLANILFATALGGVIISLPTANADPSFTDLNSQVQAQDSQLRNHEARITNNSEDIQTLEQATNTPPADNHTTVPEVYSSGDTPQAVQPEDSTFTTFTPKPALPYTVQLQQPTAPDPNGPITTTVVTN